MQRRIIIKTRRSSLGYRHPHSSAVQPIKSPGLCSLLTRGYWNQVVRHSASVTYMQSRSAKGLPSLLSKTRTSSVHTSNMQHQSQFRHQFQRGFCNPPRGGCLTETLVSARIGIRANSRPVLSARADAVG